MSGFSITIDDRQVQAALTALISHVSDLTPALEDMGRALVNITEDAFQAEASPFGQAWDALSTSYVERPRDQGGRGGDSGPILQRDGLLAASIHYETRPDQLIFGAGREYAAVHQFGQPQGASGRTSRGAPIPWGTIPARPYLPIDSAGTLAPVAQDELLRILTGYLRQSLP